MGYQKPREAPVLRAYKVVGERSVNGKFKGEFLELELTAGQEQCLIEAGHLERVEAPEPEPKIEDRALKAPVKKGASNG